MELYRIIEGKYYGRIGRIEKTKSNENIMFYPIEGEYPYRVCLNKSQVEKIV